jgi:hypothetical protein
MFRWRCRGGLWRAAGIGLVVGLAAAAGTLDAAGDTILLRPVRDATLIEHPEGALANGSGPALFAGRVSAPLDSIRRSLIAFDLSGIPAGSTVTRAVLRVNVSATNAGPVPVGLHRVLAGWGEGPSAAAGGTGAPALPGDCTWLHRFYDDVFWAAPGGDFDPVPRAVSIVDQPGLYAWGPTAEMIEDTQSWLDRPETNHGWLLAGDESTPTTVKRIDSRENPDEASRPLLEVEYTPPCAPDPVGLGYWRLQCAGGALPAPIIEDGFADRVLPCANRTLADLGLPGIDACETSLAPPPPTCEERALRQLAVLVLNVCAGRLQTGCPIAPDDAGCTATTVGDLLREIADLILAGDCRRAAGCAGVLD